MQKQLHKTIANSCLYKQGTHSISLDRALLRKYEANLNEIAVWIQYFCFAVTILDIG